MIAAWGSLLPVARAGPQYQEKITDFIRKYRSDPNYDRVSTYKENAMKCIMHDGWSDRC
jgi:hypothetical protein